MGNFIKMNEKKVKNLLFLLLDQQVHIHLIPPGNQMKLEC